MFAVAAPGSLDITDSQNSTSGPKINPSHAKSGVLATHDAFGAHDTPGELDRKHEVIASTNIFGALRGVGRRAGTMAAPRPTVKYACNNFYQSIASHHVDAPHETPHLYELRQFAPQLIRPNDVVFVKTDFLAVFLDNLRQFISSPFHLVTGHSDATPSEEAIQRVLSDPLVISWRAQNTPIEAFKLTALPMGLPEPTRSFGDQSTVAAAAATAQFRTKRPALAVPACLPTHPLRSMASAAVEALSARAEFKGMIAIAPERATLSHYLDFLAGYEYALCVRGNAIDCHRVYEAILVRTVPVYVGTVIPAFYNRLPVIVIQINDNAGSEDVEAALARFLADVVEGRAPPLPSSAEWDRYAALLEARPAR